MDERFLQRFWKYVDRDERSECWNWTGTLNEKGYGRIKYKGRSLKAHRVSYELATGEKPSGMVLHTCDNRRCVNPEHLYDGDHQQNVQDMLTRRRFDHKLTDDDVRFIRTHCKPYDKTYGTRALAERFDIDQSVVTLIHQGKIWTFLDDGL